MIIKTAGRSSTIGSLFAKAPAFQSPDLTPVHHPFLVFVPTVEGVEVQIVPRAVELLEHADHIQVMAQWPGLKRSDWFQFTVGQYREFTVAAKAGRG